MRNPESGFTPERKKGLALALGILIGAGVAIDKCVDKLTDPGSVEPAKKEVRLTPEEIKSLRKGLDTAIRVLGSLKEPGSIDEKLPEVPRFDKLKITKDFLASFPNRDWLSELSETDAAHDLLREELNDYIVMKSLEENSELKKQFEDFVKGVVVESDENSLHVYHPDYGDFDQVLTLESGTPGDGGLSYYVYRNNDKFGIAVIMTEDEYLADPNYMRQGLRTVLQYQMYEYLREKK